MSDAFPDDGTSLVDDALDEAAGLVAAWDFAAALRLLDALVENPGPHPWEVLRLRAVARRELGDLTGALADGERAADAADARYGPADPDTVRALAVVGMVRHDLGDWDVAEVLYHQVLDSGVEEDGPAGRAVRLTRANFALLQRDRGDHALALLLLNAAYAVHRREYGPDDLDTVRIAAELADTHRDAGDLVAARRLFAVAHAGASTRLGEAHPFTRSIEEELAAVEPAMPAALPVSAPPSRRRWLRRHADDLLADESVVGRLPTGPTTGRPTEWPLPDAQPNWHPRPDAVPTVDGWPDEDPHAAGSAPTSTEQPLGEWPTPEGPGRSAGVVGAGSASGGAARSAGESRAARDARRSGGESRAAWSADAGPDRPAAEPAEQPREARAADDRWPADVELDRSEDQQDGWAPPVEERPTRRPSRVERPAEEPPVDSSEWPPEDPADRSWSRAAVTPADEGPSGRRTAAGEPSVYWDAAPPAGSSFPQRDSGASPSAGPAFPPPDRGVALPGGSGFPQQGWERPDNPTTVDLASSSTVDPQHVWWGAESGAGQGAPPVPWQKLLIFGVSALVAVVVGVVVIYLVHPPRQPASPAVPPVSVEQRASAVPLGATLEDGGSTLTVRWSAQSVDVVVALAKAGAAPTVLAELPAGATSYVVRGVDRAAQYCVVLGTVLDGAPLSAAISVCTKR